MRGSAKNITFKIPTFARNAFRDLRTKPWVYDIQTDSVSTYSKYFTILGASLGSYEIAKPTQPTHGRNREARSDIMFGAFIGGLAGAVAGAFWPVGIPILISYKLATRRNKKD